MEENEDFLRETIRDSASTSSPQKSFTELLEEEKPEIEIEGEQHRIKRNELEYIDDLLGDEERGSLRLPIYFRHSSRKDEKGEYEVKGEIERKICSEILDKDYDWNRIALPEVREIKNKLPTSTKYLHLL